MVKQGELFGVHAPALVPGLVQVLEAVTPTDEAALTARIDAAPLAPFQFGQWEGKRLTTHYGRAYDFARHRLDEAPPMPPWLAALRDRLAPLAGMDPAALTAALLIRYDPGAGIGWHRDRPQYGEVLGLSLGAPCTLRLRRRTATGFERRHLDLPPRSLYRLSGEVRWEWEHSIVPLADTRRSVTFRTLR
ncbi:MAG TPA: alpha-ketoglutarate-dependent dioxygenase AlkB [Croceibacterium sp.]|nr:alpha-ketoglutarate-dependent dioxygenase AlkB [Croceibacterium sp.]